MLPDESDAARLWDMLTYAREIVQTLTGKRFADYLRDKNLRLATERRIEIIGEAARNVSDEFKSTHDRVPWRKIVGMRHVLVRQRKSGPFRVAGVLARASGGRPAHQNPLFSSDSAGETPAGRAAETAATRTCAVVPKTVAPSGAKASNVWYLTLHLNISGSWFSGLGASCLRRSI